MYISNITNDYDNITSANYTDYNVCKDNENVDTFIQTLLLTIPFGLSFLCLMSLMVYNLN